MAAVKKFSPDDEFNSMAGEWMELTARMALDKARELELRNKLIAKVYPKTIPEGLSNIPLPEGWVLKVEGKVNPSIKEDAIGDTVALIDTLVKKGDILPFSFDDVIKSKPTFSKSGFKDLDPEQKKVMLNCIEMKPGQASIDIVKPKRAVK